MDRTRLADLLGAYRNVLLLLGSDAYLEGLSFFRSLPANQDTLIISTRPVKFKSKKVPVEVVSHKDADRLRDLYGMYGFADNFLVLEEQNTAYSNIFQFVKSGVLTYEEAWQALLS